MKRLGLNSPHDLIASTIRRLPSALRKRMLDIWQAGKEPVLPSKVGLGRKLVHVPLDELIFPNRLDIQLRIELLEGYNSNSIGDYRSSSYYKFIADSSHGCRITGDKQLLEFLDLYRAVRHEGYLAPPEHLVSVAKGGFTHPIVNITDRQRISGWTGKNWEIVDGAHRVAILKYLGYESVLCQVIDRVESSPCLDYTSFILERNYPIRNEFVKSLCRDTVITSQEHSEFIGRLWRTFNMQEQQFGRGSFYQSSRRLQIIGQRLPVEDRLKLYGFLQLMEPSDIVLDIGSNIGLMVIECAYTAYKAIGVEILPCMVRVADEIKTYLGLNNCEFICSPFEKLTLTNKFTKIFSFAIHGWLKMTLDEYLSKLANMLVDDGLLLIESHDLLKMDKKFENTLRSAPSIKKFQIERSGFICDGGIHRSFHVLRKVGTAREKCAYFPEWVTHG